MEREVRSVPNSLAEVRLLGEPNKNSRSVSGYGIVFNSISKDLGGFKEVILPSAVNGVIEKSDIFALLNHNKDKGVLARSRNGKGTLKLTVDEKGVRYDFESPNYATGDELVEGLKRGDISASSFAFTVDKSGQNVIRLRDGSYLRTITQFNEIFDMSPVYSEAYSDTTATLRSMEDLKLTIEELRVDGSTEPSLEEPSDEPTGKTETNEYKMDDESRFLYQKHKIIKLKNI